MEEVAEITRLLRASSGGNAQAADELYRHVYDELHARARGYVPNRQHTLQATALVNEAYLRLAKSDLTLEDRRHFFAVSSRAMRQIMIDHARTKNRVKRGDGDAPVPLEEELFVDGSLVLEGGHEVDVLALDEALTSLAQEDERQARVVELRFFGGLSVEETAEVLEVGTATVKRDWKIARMWLMDALGSDED